MHRITLANGSSVAALSQGSWHMGEHAAPDAAFPPQAAFGDAVTRSQKRDCSRRKIRVSSQLAALS